MISLRFVRNLTCFLETKPNLLLAAVFGRDELQDAPSWRGGRIEKETYFYEVGSSVLSISLLLFRLIELVFFFLTLGFCDVCLCSVVRDAMRDARLNGELERSIRRIVSSNLRSCLYE